MDNIQMQQQQSSSYQVISAYLISYLCITTGTFLGYSSSAIVSLQEDAEFNGTLTQDDISLVGSLGAMGAIVGSFFATIPAKYIGLKGTMLYISTPCFIYSWMAIWLTNSVSNILFGRFVGGLGLGMAIAVASPYISSIVDSAHRGRLGVLPQFMMLVGILISYCIGALVEWKMHAFYCLFITVPSIVCLIYAPQPPLWLFQHNKQGEAYIVLEKLYGKDIALQEFNQLMIGKGPISNPAQGTESNAPNQTYFWFRPENLKPILISFLLMSFQQLLGIDAVIFYAVTIFKNAGGAEDSFWTGAHAPSIVQAAVQAGTALYASTLIDKVGRKSLLLLAAGVTGVSSIGLGFYFYFTNGRDECSGCYQDVFWIPVSLLVLYSIGFQIGYGPVPWMYLTEILPATIRTIIVPIVMAWTWGCVFLVTESFLYLVDLVDFYGVFWIYASFSTMGFIFILIFCPETRGKSLDEIRELFIQQRNNKISNKDNNFVVLNNDNDDENNEDIIQVIKYKAENDFVEVDMNTPNPNLNKMRNWVTFE